MDAKGRASKPPPEVVDALASWLKEKIGEVAEDDWLLLDDFETYRGAVRRQWEWAQIVSVANPEVRAGLMKRCSANLARAQTVFTKIIDAWVKRRQA
jgi:hypothetical protein